VKNKYLGLVVRVSCISNFSLSVSCIECLYFADTQPSPSAASKGEDTQDSTKTIIEVEPEVSFAETIDSRTENVLTGNVNTVADDENARDKNNRSDTSPEDEDDDESVVKEILQFKKISVVKR